MAAFQVAPDGHVIPGLNITEPAPFLNLKGFQWGAVSNDIPSSTAALPVNETSSLRAVGHAVVGHAAAALPDQLAEQLAIGEQPTPAKNPIFPLEHFKGAYAGNGFNTIFRPRQTANNTFKDFDGKTVTGQAPVNDNILEVNLTLEQVSFAGALGDIPNRGFGQQEDISLFGVPYLQTVSDVTNPDSGLPDNIAGKTSIHFEPGVWLSVPGAAFQNKQRSLTRMASIPHGTTINAQGFAPTPNPSTAIGGEPGPPNFDLPENQVDARPFQIGQPGSASNLESFFPSLQADITTSFRIPQNLKQLLTKGTITSDLLKNPNLFLKTAIQNLKITETITFEVITGNPPPPAFQASTPPPLLNGGGTANIAFLCGEQKPITTAAPDPQSQQNAHAVSMRAKYWIERVMYQVPIVKPLRGNEEMKTAVFAQMPKGSPAPTPQFKITAPPGGLPGGITIEVPGIQIQSSQTVFLNFGTLTWPHVSVSTLIPTDPILFTAPEHKG